jgi:hypothetical protein
VVAVGVDDLFRTCRAERSREKIEIIEIIEKVEKVEGCESSYTVKLPCQVPSVPPFLRILANNVRNRFRCGPSAKQPTLKLPVVEST